MEHFHFNLTLSLRVVKRFVFVYNNHEFISPSTVVTYPHSNCNCKVYHRYHLHVVSLAMPIIFQFEITINNQHQENSYGMYHLSHAVRTTLIAFWCLIQLLACKWSTIDAKGNQYTGHIKLGSITSKATSSCITYDLVRVLRYVRFFCYLHFVCAQYNNYN